MSGNRVKVRAVDTDKYGRTVADLYRQRASSASAGEYGGVVRLQLGRPTYLLSNPDDIKHVLVDNHRNYDKTMRLTSKSRWIGSSPLPMLAFVSSAFTHK